MPQPDPTLVAAVLLHDAPEFAPPQLDLDQHLTSHFGEEVARVVRALQREPTGLDTQDPVIDTHGRGVALASTADKIVAFGSLLQDLGEPTRTATITDTATALLHRQPPVPTRATWTAAVLRELPAACLDHLDQLQVDGRLAAGADLRPPLTALETVASRRADGAHIPPFGPCHGYLHPTSVPSAERGCGDPLSRGPI